MLVYRLGMANTNVKKKSSSNKRMKKMPDFDADRLSVLPDPLLIRILSRLDLKAAAVTSALSRRWQFLWTESPTLQFWWHRRGCSFSVKAINEQLHKFVGWVNRTLVIRSGNNQLDKFLVSFRYHKCFAYDVNLWIEFAVRNEVKYIDLWLNSSKEKDLHVLPQIIYSNSVVTRLSLRGCVMAPRRTVEWVSLTWLYLNKVELIHEDLMKILAGCPVLFSLLLVGCWGFNHLDLISPSLWSLTIRDEGDTDESGSLLEISAPNVHSLTISMHLERRELRLTNISSLDRADVELYLLDRNNVNGEEMRRAQELPGNLQNVKELKLGVYCIEVLAAMAKSGLRLPLSRHQHLTIDASKDAHSIRGIFCILESSPILETLILRGIRQHLRPVLIAIQLTSRRVISTFSWCI